MSNRAWVTLATNDSYGLGALVLAHSLRRTGSAYPAVVLITPSVTDAMRDRLSAVFAEVITVNVLDSRDATHLALLQRPELGITFTKIHCWSLTQYEKCVFLDADTLVVQNSDELFEREELSAAPDVGWPDCFNSGVFVFTPSADTYSRLISFAQERGSFDGGDQGLLNAFFSDWAHGDINKHLPFLYNVTSAAFYSYLPALKHFGQNLKIIHFIGNAKPWLQRFNWETRTVDAPEHLREHLQLWWDLFVGQVHTRLDPTMDPPVVEVEEASPVLLPEDFQKYYAPKLDAQSEFPWHHPDSQKKVSESQTPQLDMSRFYDPWKNYSGNVPPNQDYRFTPYTETKISEDQRETKPYVVEQNPPQQYFIQNQHVQVPNLQNAGQQDYYQHQENKQQQHHQTQVNQPQHIHAPVYQPQQQIHQVYQSQNSHTQHHSQGHDHHHHHHHNEPISQNYQLAIEQHGSEKEQHSYRDASHNHDHSHDISFHSQQEQNGQHFEHVHTHLTPIHHHDHTNHFQHSHQPHDHYTQQEPLPYNESPKHNGYNHSDPHASSADNSPNHNGYRSDIHDYGFIRLDLNTIQHSRDEQVYQVHMDLRRQNRRNRNVNRNLIPNGSVVNGHVSETDEEDHDDLIPRHPYDGFYLRHRATIDSHGRKICTHEVPPTPPSPPPSPLPDAVPPLVSSSNEDSNEVSASDGEDRSGVAGNLARLQPGEIEYQREALDELTRRQGWEAGNIDYMGADSFDNIWAKISQTLNQSPPKQPSPPRKEPTPPKEPSPPKEASTLETHAQAEMPAPAEFTAPASAPTSVQSAAPVEKPAPAKASALTEPSAPAETPAPVEALAPAEAPAPVEVSATTEVPAPVVAPATDEAPAPTEEPAAPMVVKAPIESAPAEAPAAPVPAEAPAAPVPAEAPAAPVPAEAPAAEVQTPTEASAPVEVAAEVATAPVESAPVEIAKSEAAPAQTESEAASPEALKEETKEKTEPTIPLTPPVTPKSTPEELTPVTETAPKVEATSETQSAPAAAESPKVVEPAHVAPELSKPDASATPEKVLDTSALTTASTDSPPLVHTPSKPEAPAVPPSKSEERRKPAGKLQLKPPAAADPLPTPDSEQEDAAALAQSIIASELSTTVTSPSPSAAPTSPPPPVQEKQLSVEGPEVPTPPVSLAQIGVKPKGKSTTAAQIESSVSDKSEPSAPATPTTPTTPPTPSTPTDAPKKKIVKKVVKKDSGSSGDAPTPVPPPRKKEKKPKEK